MLWYCPCLFSGKNMKTIKIILCTTLFTLFIFSCKAQTIISTENFHSYGKNLKQGDYIKDVNGVLDVTIPHSPSCIIKKIGL